MQLRELRRATNLVDVVADPAQLAGELFDGRLERGRVEVAGEQVNIVRYPIDHPVLPDGAGAGESERVPVEGNESCAGQLAL